MNRMTKEEMIEFLKGMDQRRRILEEEKQRVRGSVETLEEAIQRNNFSRNSDESGIISLSDPQTGVGLMGDDRIVTLSTCTESSQIRMTVQGKLIWKRNLEEIVG